MLKQELSYAGPTKISPSTNKLYILVIILDVYYVSTEEKKSI